MAATSRLPTKQQTLSDAYAVPANFLEIDVCEPETHGIGNKRYTDYEVRLKVCCFFIWTNCNNNTNKCAYHSL